MTVGIGLVVGDLEHSWPRALVAGPVGADKSRLATEFIHRLRQAPKGNGGVGGVDKAPEPAVWTANGDAMRAGAALSLLAELIARAR